jgi:hypothetical protein
MGMSWSRVEQNIWAAGVDPKSYLLTDGNRVIWAELLFQSLFYCKSTPSLECRRFTEFVNFLLVLLSLLQLGGYSLVLDCSQP